MSGCSPVTELAIWFPVNFNWIEDIENRKVNLTPLSVKPKNWLFIIIVLYKNEGIIIKVYIRTWASLVAQTLKSLPAVLETWVQTLGGKIPWSREWQPTPVFLPGESHGQRSLEGCGPWGCKELDITEQLTLT